MESLRRWQEAGIALVRVVTGFFMAYHGWEVFNAETMKGYFGWDAFKGFSDPSLVVYTGKAVELVAGIFLAVGIFTRISSLILIITMTYIAFFIGNGKVWYEDQHPFMFVLLGAIYFILGGGRYSIDALWQKKR